MMNKEDLEAWKRNEKTLKIAQVTELDCTQ